MTTKTESVQKESLWTLNFILLWQGQFVSSLGDVFYQISLGFWILDKTGSTTLMGALIAASVLPRVLISPFAGVAVDRTSRRKVLFWSDLIRGIAFVFVGIAAYKGFVTIWMVFASAIILGSCEAFFNPAVYSSIPDIVPKSKLIRANSIFGMIYSSSNIIGNPIGGILYNLFKAPFMFLINGISFLFFSLTAIFLKIPKVNTSQEKTDFFVDMKEGFVFVWKFKGLRYIIAVSSVLYFFANMAIILFIPLFHKTPWLGPGKYGIAMAVVTGGMFLGVLFTSIVNIPSSQRLKIFIVSAVLSSISTAIFSLVKFFPLMLTLLFIGGLFISIISVFLNASVQLTVPPHMRGKVLSLMGTLIQGLSPVAMAIGGILAEFIPIRIIISSCFTISLIIFITFAFMSPFKKLINFDPDQQTLEDIM